MRRPEQLMSWADLVVGVAVRHLRGMPSGRNVRLIEAPPEDRDDDTDLLLLSPNCAALTCQLTTWCSVSCKAAASTVTHPIRRDTMFGGDVDYARCPMVGAL